MGDPRYHPCSVPNEDNTFCRSCGVPFSDDDSFCSSCRVPFSEDESSCSSSDVPFSIPMEYAYNNNNPLIGHEQDLNAKVVYNDSTSKANTGLHFLCWYGYAAISAPTMHPNLVSTLKSLLDIDNNGRNYDHNEAKASAGSRFGHEEKTESQHGHQSQGECSQGDSNSPTFVQSS